MSLTTIDQLPDSARLWCFAADRPLSADETARLLGHVRDFLGEWAAHGQPLRTACDWRRGRFLLVAVDERAAGASGCSIDSLTHRLGHIEAELGVRLRDGAPVWYLEPRGQGVVRQASRQEFRALAEEGRVDGATTVFDLTAGRLADVREGRWERPAAESWHARLLPSSAPARAGRPGDRA
jgi:hypothetical protein